jgi:mannose-1-phosphate guanylyltransferase
VNAIVLVGGEGTRLRPLTFTTPKQLLPVAGVPMIERVLGSLARHGVDQAVLSLGYKPDAFLAAYPDDVAAGVRLSYAVEPEPLDTAGAIRFAAEEAKLTGTFVVVNGDVLTDLDLSALVAFHHGRRAVATIALVPVEDPSRFGVVPTDAKGRVTAFVEKPPPGSAPTNAINAGTYVLEPEVLDRIPAGRRVSVERETFPALAAESALYALVSEAYWLDTGTPAAYLQANADLVSGRRGLPPAPGALPAPEGGPGVWRLGSPVLAGEIDGPSLVGDGAELRSGSLVRASVVGEGVVVHSGARVESSVLLAGSVVEQGALVRSSIVGARAHVGRGAVLEGRSVVGDGALVEAGARVVEGRIGPGPG